MDYGKHKTPLLASLLALAVLAVYWQTTGFQLINLDDPYYTVLYPAVSEGFTFSGIWEVFSSIRFWGYMPVTLVSYMADVEIFGLEPWGFHFTNTLLHLVNSLLLFEFLRRATGSVWKSFFAAALWAVHPLRAESVAWVSERKDVLSGLFFLSGLILYCEYAKRKSSIFYWAALSAMLLGLMSKPVMVVFPGVLLILDFWPLGRLKGKEDAKELLVEKAPFAALAAAFSLLVVVSQSSGIVTSNEGVLTRLQYMATSYVQYLQKTFWPVGLVLEDQHTTVRLGAVSAILTGLLLIGITAALFKARKAAPAVLAGWLWYLLALFPVSGVVPMGLFRVADHFTYVPHIGLVIALVWGAENLFGKFAKDMVPLAAAGGAAAVVLAVLCWGQVSLWKDDLTLFGHIEKVSGGKSRIIRGPLSIVFFNQAVASYKEKRFADAREGFGKALRYDPKIPKANGYMGISAAALGRYLEAAELLKKELETTPDDRDFSVRLANVLILSGDLPGGARQTLDNIRRWPADKDVLQTVDYLGGEAKAREIAGLKNGK